MRIMILRIGKCALFLVLLLALLLSINGVMEPKYYSINSDWPSTATYNQFYRMEKNSIDVLFLGSSVCVNAFSPMQLYKQYQIRSYNLGSDQQSLFLSYYWLREALRYQSPEAVVVDARFCTTYHEDSVINTSEGLTRKCLDPMRFSPVKAEAVRELCRLDDAHSELSYYFTNFRFHAKWASLKEVDFYRGDLKYARLMGYAPGNGMERLEFGTFDPQDPQAETDKMHALSMEYLDRIAQLCREKGIEMILVNIAGNQMDDGINNVYTRFAQEHGIKHYNFCETSLYQAVGAQLPEESIIGHGNLKGAIKFTDFVGKLLVEEHGIRGVQDSQWENLLPFYESVIAQEELKLITELPEYLARIPEDCTLFISAKDEASSGMSPQIQQALDALGLKTVWDESMLRQGYIAVVSPDGIVEGAKGVQTHSSRFAENHQYTIISKGRRDGNVSSVVIDGQEYSQNRRGLNLVVYSHYYDEVIDKVTFDTYQTDAKALRK